MANGTDTPVFEVVPPKAPPSNQFEVVPPHQDEPWYQRTARGVLSTLGLPETLADVPGWAERMTENRNTDPNVRKASDAAAIASGGASRILENLVGGMGIAQLETFQKPGWQNKIAGLVPLAGPIGSKAADEINQGNYAGAAGTVISPVVATLGPKAPGAIADAVSSARESIGSAIHTPEGEMTSGGNLAGKVVGGAAGGAVGALFGHEYLGAAAGYKLGPSLMERMFPEPANQVAARENFLNTQELTEAHEAALKEAERRANTQRIVTQRALKAEQASRDELWQARDQMAQDLMNRQKQQDALDAADVRAQNAAARAKRQGDADAAKLQKAADKAAQDAEDARNEHAQALLDRQKQQDLLDAKHAKALKALEDARQQEITMWSKFNQQGEEAQPKGDLPQGTSTPFGNPQDLISRTKKIVKPGEAPSEEDLKRAGDMTQVPLPRLKLLASWGDELAKNEIIRRLRNP